MKCYQKFGTLAEIINVTDGMTEMGLCYDCKERDTLCRDAYDLQVDRDNTGSKKLNRQLAELGRSGIIPPIERGDKIECKR